MVAPSKLVSQIVSGKFVELSELLSSKIAQTQSNSDPQLFFDGWLVLQPRLRSQNGVSTILAVGWRLFSVYCLVLTSLFPHRWKDPLLYQLLIADLWPVHQLVLLEYDRAGPAATNLTHWSTLNVHLFNFHTARASVHGPDTVYDSNESRGAASCNTICRSWNCGQPFRLLPFCTQVLELLWPTPCWRLSWGLV